MDMFVKLYKLLSDPTYDRAVYNEVCFIQLKL